MESIHSGDTFSMRMWNADLRKLFAAKRCDWGLTDAVRDALDPGHTCRRASVVGSFTAGIR